MDKKTVLDVISRFREAIESKGIKVSKLVLFGSCATGRNREGSDIDIVVISNDFADKSYWERIGILSDAIYEVFEPIEAVAMTLAEWRKKSSLIAEYARNGKVVYTG